MPSTSSRAADPVRSSLDAAPELPWGTALRAERERLGAPRVSAVVRASGGGPLLAASLRTLAWVDEVVVDAQGAAEARAIAEALGASVVEPGHGAVEERATGDWVLLMEAEEQVSEGLARDLVAATLEGGAEAVAVPVARRALGSWIHAAGAASQHQPRLFRRPATRSPETAGAVPGAGDGSRLTLPDRGDNRLLRIDAENLSDALRRLDRATSTESRRRLADGAPPSWDDAVARARAELAARWAPGLDGTRSAALSVLGLLEALVAHAKAWELAGWPQIELPADAATALRALGAGGDGRRRTATGALERGDARLAAEELLAAVRDAVDPTLLSDAAGAATLAGSPSAGSALMEVAHLLAPEAIHAPSSRLERALEGAGISAPLLAARLRLSAQRVRELGALNDAERARADEEAAQRRALEAQLVEARARVETIEARLMSAARTRAVAEHGLYTRIRELERQLAPVTFARRILPPSAVTLLGRGLRLLHRLLRPR